MRLSAVGRSDIRFPLKDNLIPCSFSSVFSELIYIFVYSIPAAGPRNSALDNKIVLILDKNFPIDRMEKVLDLPARKL